MNGKRFNHHLIMYLHKVEFLYRADPQNAMQYLVRVCLALHISNIGTFTHQESVNYLKLCLTWNHPNKKIQRPGIQSEQSDKDQLRLHREAERELHLISKHPKQWYVFYREPKQNGCRFVRAVNAQDVKHLLVSIKEMIKKNKF